MNIRRISLLLIGICGYVQVILYNGIIKHLGLCVSSIEGVRPFLPEFFLIVYLVGWIISEKQYKKNIVMFIFWLIAVCVMSIISAPSITAILSAIRDLLEPCLFLITLSTMKLTNKEKKKLVDLLENSLIIFVLIGAYFAISQKINDPQATAMYFTGHSVWGVDVEDGIRMSTGAFGFKVLGTTASAETFGFYNMFAIIVVLFSRKRRIVKIAITVFSFVNMYCSGMKTAILVAILVMYIYLTYRYGKKARLIVKIGFVLIMVGLFYYMVFVLSDWEESSVYARLVLWKSLLSKENLINLFIPTKAFFYSAKAGNKGIISFWDNSYLYFAYSTGIVGLAMLVNLLNSKVKALYKICGDMINAGSMVLLSILLSGLSTCLFLGRNYLAIAIIYVCIMASVTEDEQVES